MRVEGAQGFGQLKAGNDTPGEDQYVSAAISGFPSLTQEAEQALLGFILEGCTRPIANASDRSKTFALHCERGNKGNRLRLRTSAIPTMPPC